MEGVSTSQGSGRPGRRLTLGSSLHPALHFPRPILDYSKPMTALGFGNLIPVPITRMGAGGRSQSLSSSTLQSCAGMVSVVLTGERAKVTPVDSHTLCWGRFSDDSPSVLADSGPSDRGPAVKWQQHQACGQSPHLWPDTPNKNQAREQSIF